jgi:hypothetical protein
MRNAGEIEPIVRAMLGAIERNADTVRDPAAAQAARISVGAALLAESVRADEVAAAVNGEGLARGWRFVRVQ